MAAPSEVTLQDLNGKWVMNKTLSDDFDPVLALQGVGWLTRKAISFATITLAVQQYRDDAGVTHVDIAQTLTGGIKGTTELRAFNGQWRAHSDHIFGDVKGWSRFVPLADVASGDAADDAFLRAGWAAECAGEGRVAESRVESVGNGWVATQVWGFEEVQVAGKAERRYVRHVVVRRRKEGRRVRLVYDWLGKE